MAVHAPPELQPPAQGLDGDTSENGVVEPEDSWCVLASRCALAPSQPRSHVAMVGDQPDLPGQTQQLTLACMRLGQSLLKQVLAQKSQCR